MKITIGFSRPKSFKIFSFFIRLYQGWTPYSHAFLSIPFTKFDRTIICEASHSDVHFIEQDRFKENNKITDQFEVEINESEYKDLMQFCIDNCQKPYGVTTIIGLFFRINEFKDSNKRFICSELVAKAMKIGNDDYITPKDLYNLVKAKYNG
jgi:beta-xylosidase